ncbi:MAG: ribosome maturation factor RimM [Clostridia bacterium]
MIINFLEIGQIVSTHGIKGEIRLQPWCDGGEFVKGFTTLYLDKQGEKPMKVTLCRPHGNIVIMKLEGIESVEDAMKYKGKTLYMKRSDADLDEGQYFVQELIGCEVFDADEATKMYGKITDVSQTGANDVWHILGDDGKEYLIPSIPPVVIDVDVVAEKVMIRPLRGIFEDED